MSLKICSGLLKGLQVRTPSGQQTRPTSAKVREAVFNSLADKTLGAVFIDCFAGSGAVGLEAISWGASQVYFIENSRTCVKNLQQNIDLAKEKCIRDQLEMPFFSVLQHKIEFKDLFSKRLDQKNVDILWFDPPYALVEKLVCQPAFWVQVEQVMDQDGVVLIESRKSDSLTVEEFLQTPEASCGWHLQRVKYYSDTAVHWLCKASK